MPFWLVKLKVSPLRKPAPIDTVAPARLPLLSTSLTINAPSSGTDAPPPVKVAVDPDGVTTGATCTVSSVLVAAVELATPSLTTKLMVLVVSLAAPPVGSPLAGVKLYFTEPSAD